MKERRQIDILITAATNIDLERWLQFCDGREGAAGAEQKGTVQDFVGCIRACRSELASHRGQLQQ